MGTVVEADILQRGVTIRKAKQWRSGLQCNIGDKEFAYAAMQNLISLILYSQSFSQAQGMMHYSVWQNTIFSAYFAASCMPLWLSMTNYYRRFMALYKMAKC